MTSALAFHGEGAPEAPVLPLLSRMMTAQAFLVGQVIQARYGADSWAGGLQLLTTEGDGYTAGEAKFRLSAGLLLTFLRGIFFF